MTFIVLASDCHVTHMGPFPYLIGSFHMMSQARALCSMGSGRMVGMSLMAEMSPSPRTDRGMPPWTQKTCVCVEYNSF